MVLLHLADPEWDEVGLCAALRSSKVESDSEEDQAKLI